MRDKIAAGTTSYSAPIYVTNSSTGAGLGSLVFNTSSLVGEYRRAGQSSWTSITLSAGTLGTWSSGGWIADGSLTGAYEVGIPNAALASGVAWVAVRYYGAASMSPVLLYFELDAVNYQAGDLGFSGQSLPTNPTANTWGEGLFLADIIGGRRNTAQAGASTSITLDASASSDAGAYVGDDIYLMGGTGGGIRGTGQRRTITAYNTSTKVATVNRAWDTTPDNTTGFITLPQALANVGLINGAAAATVSGAVNANITDWGGTAVAGTIPPDVVFLRSGTAQGGGASTITLDSGASATNNFYQNQVIFLRSGTGAGQSAIITSYVGSTKVATIVGTWATNPDNTSVFTILPFGSITTTVSGGVNVTQWNGINVTAATAGIPDVNVKNYNNQTAQTDANNLPKTDIEDIRGTLSVATAGYMGLDWAHINAPTTSVNLSGTTVGTITTYTGNTPQTGDAFARIGSNGAGLTSLATASALSSVASGVAALPSAAAIATAVLTDVGDNTTAGSPGKILAQLGGTFTTTSSSVFTTPALANAPAGGGGSGVTLTTMLNTPRAVDSLADAAWTVNDVFWSIAAMIGKNDITSVTNEVFSTTAGTTIRTAPITTASSSPFGANVPVKWG